MADPLPLIYLDAAGTAEKRRFKVTASDDPTGQAPDFAVTAVDRTPGADEPESSDWKPGTWPVAWDSTLRVAWAETPLMGTGQALNTPAGSQSILWMRANYGGGHLPLRRVAVVEVRG